MAYFSTEPASQRRNVNGKSRVWDFFSFSSKTHPANRRQPAQPRRKIGPTATKTALGMAAEVEEKELNDLLIVKANDLEAVHTQTDGFDTASDGIGRGWHGPGGPNP